MVLEALGEWGIFAVYVEGVYSGSVFYGSVFSGTGSFDLVFFEVETIWFVSSDLVLSGPVLSDPSSPQFSLWRISLDYLYGRPLPA